jgi:FMN-dependent oxidoreductase (nitrilotriacetate monooxygenase family)
MTIPRDDQMRMAAFLNAGPGGVCGWRHPGAELNFFSPAYYQHIARVLEEGLFDLLFIPDSQTVPRALGNSIEINVRHGVGTPRLEPLTVLSALATSTSQLGLVATASTGFQEPYGLARQLSTLDHLTDGRAGWNIVTSFQDAEAQNYSLDRLQPRAERYERASEFLEVTGQLWDSWEDGALDIDRALGTFARPEKVHEINYAGKYFKVRGPLGIPRSPQGYPLLVQAGASPQGRDFAAHWADVIFASHESIASAVDFYTDVKRRAEAIGRDPDDIKILTAATTVIGATPEEALALHHEFEELVPAEAGLSRLAYHVDYDFSKLDLDGPLPDLDVPGVSGHWDEVVEYARRENATVRQVGKWYGARTEGNLVGSVTQVVDRMEEWFTNRACDGFMIQPTHPPVPFEQITRLVVPELQRRGLFRTEYSGGTLRENLGLPRPQSGEWRLRAGKTAVPA